jgi:hypothetical protein
LPLRAFTRGCYSKSPPRVSVFFIIMIDVNKWLDIPWYESIYQILISENKVKSLKFWKVKILKVAKWIWWHLYFWVKENFRHKNMYLHRLVMLIKEWPCPEWMEVCHNDWNPANNHPDNLRYWTRSDNVQDSIKHWTFHKFDNPMKWKFYWENPRSLKINQYSLSWEFIKEWDCIKSFLNTIGKENSSSISYCCKWKHKTAYWFIWKYKNKIELSDSQG